MIDYSAGVPGSALLIDGHMRLKVRAFAAEGSFFCTLFFFVRVAQTPLCVCVCIFVCGVCV